MKGYLLLAVISLATLPTVLGQGFKLRGVALKQRMEEGKQVIDFSYQIRSYNYDEEFSLALYYYLDGKGPYRVDEKYLSGDTANLSSEESYRISWEAERELGVFSGGLQPYLVVERAKAPLTFLQVNGDKFKRNEVVFGGWDGGLSTDHYKIKVFYEGKEIKGFPYTINEKTKTFSFRIPKRFPKSREYYVQLEDLEGEDTIASKPFRVK